MPSTPPRRDQHAERRRTGLSRISTVTATTALGAGGVTLAVAAGLAVSHASAAGSVVTTNSGSGSDSGVPAAASPGSGPTAAGVPPSNTERQRGRPPAGGLAPGQGDQHAQTQGS